jgi:hypothetical protein
VTVVVVPVPVVDTFPGTRVRVHVPVAGNPFTTTLPVGFPKRGWVIIPINGEDGVMGEAGITTAADEGETHPDEFVTVKV